MRVKLPTSEAGVIPPFAFTLHEFWNNISGDFVAPDKNVYTDDPNWLASSNSAYGPNVYVYNGLSGGDMESIVGTSDWAAADNLIGVAKIGEYIYVGYTDNATSATRVYRYDVSNIGSGTQMTLTTLGTTSKPTKMLSDGTNLYFDQDGGDTASSNHIFEKYTISGTSLTADSKITCGATTNNFADAEMDTDGNFYGYAWLTDLKVRRHNSSGTLQATQTSAFSVSSPPRFKLQILGIPYIHRVDTTNDFVAFMRIPLIA